ncbi:hypothetical protein BpHYR1_022883 [Brachionus plicatilis]|uniref:Uncharacterized protein n=1 Tax=Brachionus plicatilis TaxID=10195 RepID=A0A3M7Q7H9_BRAPC|nr:hypothetical protein BpHYR1_022883 [Brachionus plicatilis]
MDLFQRIFISKNKLEIGTVAVILCHSYSQQQLQAYANFYLLKDNKTEQNIRIKIHRVPKSIVALARAPFLKARKPCR